MKVNSINNNPKLNFKGAYRLNIRKTAFSEMLCERDVQGSVNCAVNIHILTRMGVKQSALQSLGFLSSWFGAHSRKDVMFFKFPGYEHIQQTLEEKGVASVEWLSGYLNRLLSGAELTSVLPEDANRESYSFLFLTGAENKEYVGLGSKINKSVRKKIKDINPFRGPNWTKNDDKLLKNYALANEEYAAVNNLMAGKDITHLDIDTLADVQEALSHIDF